ncbi:MAG: permease prefix domain 1-containing protein, partial [Brachybacterium sp.]
MNVIDSYLDTLFAPYPETPRLREARTELRAMMEDKLQGLIEDGLPESQAVGQVIAEFGTLEEAAPVLGIDAELGRASAAHAAPPTAALELDRARAYVEATHRSQWLPAAGLALFVLSAAPLLLLIATTTDRQGEPPGWAIGAGITAVLVMVSLGLLLMMVRGARLSEFEDIDDGDFTLTAQVRSYAQGVKREHRHATILATAVAITLWILSALPTLLSALLTDGESPATLYGVSGTLVIV